MSKRKPEVNKQINATLRKFKNLLKKKLGEDVDVGKLTFEVLCSTKKNNLDLVERSIEESVKESGLSEFFQSGDGGFGFGVRDTTFYLK